MPKMIQVGQEVIRINPTQPNQIQYSTNGGRIWMTRFTGSSTGDFIDLIAYKNELIAITTKGIYYSQDNGRMWSVRYSGTAYGTFQSLAVGGCSYGNGGNCGNGGNAGNGSNGGNGGNGGNTGRGSAGSSNNRTGSSGELLAQTTKGIYYSTNSGRTWIFRHN